MFLLPLFMANDYLDFRLDQIIIHIQGKEIR